MFRRSLKKRGWAISTAALLAAPGVSMASVAIEQIEAETVTQSGNTLLYSQYAPVEFGGSATVAGTASFAGITFHAIDTANDTNTNSSHAYYVATDMFNPGHSANGLVTDDYCLGADDFLNNYVRTNNATGVYTLPRSLQSGVQVVNDSWVGSYQGANSPYTFSTDLDAQRRYDYMVNSADVVSVAGAVGNGVGDPLLWACYNTIGVSGSQGFNPSGNQTKQHADLSDPTMEASRATGYVSGVAAALIGYAQNANQTDAQHSYVVRSLLLTGADKIYYTNPGGGSAGGMDGVYGAGQVNFFSSVAVLQAGERNMSAVSNNTAAGTPVYRQKGWSFGNVSAGTQDVVLIQSMNTLTGISAALNWNVTSQTAAGGNLNTSNAAEIFPNLTLELRPVTYNSGSDNYVLGTTKLATLLQSSVANDNTQYIYDNTVLPAGTYALLITGDPTRTTTVGISYSLSGSFGSQWNSSAGGNWGTTSLWTNGIPDGPAAQANFLASPGLTAPGIITVGQDRTVGQITLNNPNGYNIAYGTIAQGDYGVLHINDTGDSTGTANPLITVLSGSQIISSPLNLSNGVTTNISAGSSLTLGSYINGQGSVMKTGPGSVTLAANESAGPLAVNGGTFSITTAGVISGGPITVNTGGTLSLTASTGSGVFNRTLPTALNINAGGSVVVQASALNANRQLLLANGGLTISGNVNAWTGKLDLNNNDADLPGVALSNVSNQILEGFNQGNWNGSGGIISTSAANDTRHLTALGVIQNNQGGTALFNASGGTNPFDGTYPGPSDILIKYTYYGDANLSGKVDSADYTLIDNGYLLHLTGWYNGDFNYDGAVNGSDYTLIDNAFNTQGAQIMAVLASPTATISTQATGAVPEPSSVGLLAVVASGLLARRRYRKTPTSPCCLGVSPASGRG
jgi:hypothetical protein